MNENRIDRRDMCKNLLALGGVALVGATINAQQATQTATPTLDPVLQDQRIADAVKRGATMEEIAKLREPIASTPAEAIRALKAGNSRFFSGSARRPELSAAERRSQILAQTPFAVVLSCSDRTLFITRVAGKCN